MNVPVSITASGAHPGVAAPALPVAGRRPRITLTVMPPSFGDSRGGGDYLRGKGRGYAPGAARAPRSGTVPKCEEDPGRLIAGASSVTPGGPLTLTKADRSDRDQHADPAHCQGHAD